MSGRDMPPMESKLIVSRLTPKESSMSMLCLVPTRFTLASLPVSRSVAAPKNPLSAEVLIPVLVPDFVPRDQ